MTDMEAPEGSNTSRLEELWAGGFGEAYLERNADVAASRQGFWDGFMRRFPANRVLEVGCTQGDNLIHIARHTPAHEVWGVDLNHEALAALLRQVPGVNGAWGLARSLPFRDSWFDLVFTVGLLIHQPDETLPLVMGEIVRTSRRWIMCGEYYAKEPISISYRGHNNVLFKRDYGRIYGELFPELTLIEEGYLTKEEGFDRVTYQVFAK